MATRKRKKRAKKHYHTGVHISSKTGQECHFRSGWEKTYCEYLDVEPTVKSYSYESVVICYISNVSSGRHRKYFPDFLVEYVDGSKVLVEIKPSKRLNNRIVVKKLEAARVWCSEHGATLQIITEKELSVLKRTLKEYSEGRGE